MSQIKNRNIIEKVANYEAFWQLTDNNKVIAKIDLIKSPTNNCQLCVLINADSFYKMSDNNILTLFRLVQRQSRKYLINFSISDKRSYNKFLKLSENTKSFTIKTNNEFMNFKNKKSNLITILWKR